jgi:probable phosphoglycerate mutase
LREFAERAVGTITRIALEGKYRRVALVTHGGVLECAYRAAQGIGFSHARDFDIFNASINRFTWSGQAIQLANWGDIAHLQTRDFLALVETDK